MNYFHPEFEFCKAWAASIGARARRMVRREEPKAKGLNPLSYTVALSSALRANNLKHELHDVMACVAKLQVAVGHATAPQVAAELGCSYQNVRLHLWKNGDLFAIDGSVSPGRVTLTPEGIRLMGAIKQRIDKSTN